MKNAAHPFVAYQLAFSEDEQLLEGAEVFVCHRLATVYLRGSLSAVRRRVVLDAVHAEIRRHRAYVLNNVPAGPG